MYSIASARIPKHIPPPNQLSSTLHSSSFKANTSSLLILSYPPSLPFRGRHQPPPEDRNECEKLKYRERRKTLARQKRLERPPLSADELAAASQGGWDDGYKDAQSLAEMLSLLRDYGITTWLNLIDILLCHLRWWNGSHASFQSS